MRYDAWWVELLRTKLMAGLRLFYADIRIEGQDNVPRKGPLILASNHNNAVLDALVLGFFSGGRRPGFLTRSDVFKRPLLQKLFTRFRMIPVYRLRDGVDIKTANQATFDEVAQWLSRGQSAVIFPEGDKGKSFHLLRLKKGTARMACHALPKLEADLLIVPAGITYERLHAIRTRVVVRYGPPIRVQDYETAYAKHPDLTLKGVTDDLERSIQQLMWHVPEADVPLLQWWIDMQRKGTYRDQVSKAHRWWQQLSESDRTTWRYRIAQWRLLGVYPKAIHRPFPLGAIFVALLLGPWVAEGLLWLFLPYFLPSWMAQRLSRHPHFHTSIRFGLLFLFFPFFSLLQGLLLAWVLPGTWAWLAVAVVVLLPVVTWQWTRAITSLRWWLAGRQVPDHLKREIAEAQATLS